jgi:hypothetical protein
LVKRPDQRVARVAEPLTRRRVELRDQLRGVTLDACADSAAVILDEVHHKQIGVGIMHMRDWELGLAHQLVEHVGLKVEAGTLCASRLPRLDSEMPAVGDPDFEPDESESDAERAGLDDARAEHLLGPRSELAVAHRAVTRRPLMSQA